MAEPLAVGVLAVGLTALAAAEGAQDSPRSAVFPSRSEAVTVDVVVLDEQGRPVKGLRREDFVVREDGSARVVSGFQEITPAAADAGVAPPDAHAVEAASGLDTNADALPERGRALLVVFDDVHLTLLEARRAKQAVDRFLDTRVRNGDHVTLLATSGGVRRSAQLPDGLSDLHAWIAARGGLRAEGDPRGRISAWEARRVHLLRDDRLAAEIARRLREVGLVADNVDTATGPGSIKDFQLDEDRNPTAGSRGEGGDASDSKIALVRAQAAAIYMEATAHARAALGSLRDLLDALSVASGRKTVVFVSAGFFHDPAEPLFAQVTDAARRANAAVDFIDARELGGLPDNTPIEMERVTDPRDHAVYDRNLHDAEGTESIAIETGGLVLRGRLEDALDRVARESESYYLLGYEPGWTQADGRFHRIAVEVNRPGVKVRARRGYHATVPSPASGGLHPDLRRARESPLEAAGVTLSLASYVFGPAQDGRTLVALAGLAAGASVSWTPSGGRYTGGLETAFRVTPLAGGEPVDRERRHALSLGAAEHAEALGTGLPLLGDFELVPGRYLARLVARDTGSGRVGSVLHEFEVPGPGFRLGTPIVTDTLRTGPGGEPTPIPLARRTFAGGKRLYCSFEVLGAAPGAGGGAARATFEIAVFRADGSVLARSPAQMLAPGPAGELERMIAVSLEDAAPDEYRLVLRVRDEATGQAVEHQERFRVAGAAVAASTAAAPAGRPVLPVYSELVSAYARGETSRALHGLSALGPARTRDGARGLRRTPGCDVRCARAAALMHTEAAAQAGSAVETDAHLSWAREALEGGDGPERASWLRDWLLAAGYLLQGQSRFPEALRLFEQAERAAPGDAEALVAQGSVAEVLSLLPDLAPRTREPAPAGSAMLPELVERAIRERHETRALELYERALAKNPALRDAQLRHARIRGRRGATDEAAASLTAVRDAAAEPHLRALASLFLGELEDRAGRPASAAECYRQALAARSGFQTAAVALARALLALGQRAAADRAIEQSLSGSPLDADDPWIGYHQGLAWRRDSALAALRRRLAP